MLESTRLRDSNRSFCMAVMLWLAQVRQSSEVAYKSRVIQYHQARNRTARLSRQRRGAGLPEEGQRRRRSRYRHRRRRREAGVHSP